MARLERHSTRLSMFTSSLIREVVECWVIDMDRLMASVDPSWGEMDLDAQAAVEVDEEADLIKTAVVNELTDEAADEARRLREEIVKINTRIDALQEMVAEKAERLRKVMNGEVDLAGLDSGIVEIGQAQDEHEEESDERRAIGCARPERGGARAALQALRSRIGRNGAAPAGAMDA